MEEERGGGVLAEIKMLITTSDERAWKRRNSRLSIIISKLERIFTAEIKII
jgi:hypothetical protein